MDFRSVPVAQVFRGDVIESVHWGSAAVVDKEGCLLYKVGDPYLITYFRSSAKPFQAIPLVESGAAKSFGLILSEIALIAGSHSGEDFHVQAVQSILKKIGLTSTHLKCGTHKPHKYKALKQNSFSQTEFSVLEHNCSGKHAGMLALAVFGGYSIEDYLLPSHPVQKAISQTIGEICNYPVEKIAIGIDGCSAPIHALPLYNMAWGFAKLVASDCLPEKKAQACKTILEAMLQYPEMVAGTARYDTVIAQAKGEPLVAKAGAEGLECFGLVKRRQGAAVKIADGASRALYPVATQLLCQLGVRSEDEKLKDFLKPSLSNWQGIEVGHIQAQFEIEQVGPL